MVNPTRQQPTRKVTFNLKINKKGKFKGKIKTKGNKLFKNSSKKVKITVK